MPSNLSLALIGCLHIKPMIIGNYLSLNKKRKWVCVTMTLPVLFYLLPLALAYTPPQRSKVDSQNG